MKATTQDYRKAMDRLLREKSHVEITFQNIDPAASTDGVWTDNGHMHWSEKSTLDYDFDYGPTVYTAEQNRILLDDNYYFLEGPESSAQDGFVSDKLSVLEEFRTDSYSGELQSNEVSYFGGDTGIKQSEIITFNRKFSKKRIFPGITVTFDRRCSEWPLGITLRVFRDGKEVDSLVTRVTGVVQYIPLFAIDVDGIQMDFWDSVPNRRVRIERILFGAERIFRNKDITRSVQKHDVDPLTRRLPKEDFKFSIIDFEHEYDFENPNGIWRFIDEQSPVFIRYGIETGDGRTEWLQPDRYILNGKPEFKNNIVSFAAGGLLSTLKGTYYKDSVGNKTLFDMATAVLRDAKLTPDRSGNEPWVIDESLKNLWTTGLLPIKTHAECLQMIAHAAGCRLYTDDQNVIHITPFDLHRQPSTGLVVDYNSVIERSQSAKKVPLLKAVEVKQHGLVQDKEATVLYKGVTQSGLLHVEYKPSNLVKIKATGGTVVSQNVYSQAADIQLEGRGDITVEISGNLVKDQTTVFTYAAGESGEVDKIDNPLMTWLPLIDSVAKHTAEYLALRNTYDMSYRGNPEIEVGDKIGVETAYSENIDSLVLTDEISFAGALRGKLRLKGIGGASTVRRSF